nr:MAG TPA: hypothetical protein [Caudoviricetes sp.]
MHVDNCFYYIQKPTGVKHISFFCAGGCVVISFRQIRTT